MKWYEKQKKMYVQNQGEQSADEEKVIADQEEKEIQQKNQTSTQQEVKQNDKLAKKPPVNKETSVIQKETTIQGDISSEDNITIHGILNGNVRCCGNLIVSGSIKGNVTCQNAVLQKAKIEGDMQCEQHLEISEETTIKGNIRVCDILCSGTIHGDTIISEKAKFLSTSCIIGDVQTKLLEIEAGAILQGNLIVESDVQK